MTKAETSWHFPLLFVRLVGISPLWKLAQLQSIFTRVHSALVQRALLFLDFYSFLIDISTLFFAFLILYPRWLLQIISHLIKHRPLCRHFDL